MHRFMNVLKPHKVYPHVMREHERMRKLIPKLMGDEAKQALWKLKLIPNLMGDEAKQALWKLIKLIENLMEVEETKQDDSKEAFCYESSKTA